MWAVLLLVILTGTSIGECGIRVPREASPELLARHSSLPPAPPPPAHSKPPPPGPHPPLVRPPPPHAKPPPGPPPRPVPPPPAHAKPPPGPPPRPVPAPPAHARPPPGPPPRTVPAPPAHARPPPGPPPRPVPPPPAHAKPPPGPPPRPVPPPPAFAKPPPHGRPVRAASQSAQLATSYGPQKASPPSVGSPTREPTKSGLSDPAPPSLVLGKPQIQEPGRRHRRGTPARDQAPPIVEPSSRPNPVSLPANSGACDRQTPAAREGTSQCPRQGSLPQANSSGGRHRRGSPARTQGLLLDEKTQNTKPGSPPQGDKTKINNRGIPARNQEKSQSTRPKPQADRSGGRHRRGTPARTEIPPNVTTSTQTSTSPLPAARGAPARQQRAVRDINTGRR